MPMVQFWMSVGLFLTGTICLVAGIRQWSEPAAWIAVGAVLLFLAARPLTRSRT